MASTCQHCAPVKQTLEELAEKYGDDMSLKTWTIDTNPAAMKMAREWKVRGVPTMILLTAGEQIGYIVGAHTKERIDELIQSCIQGYVLGKNEEKTHQENS